MLKNENGKAEAVTSCHQILMIQNLKSQRGTRVSRCFHDLVFHFSYCH